MNAVCLRVLNIFVLLGGVVVAHESSFFFPEVEQPNVIPTTASSDVSISSKFQTSSLANVLTSSVTEDSTTIISDFTTGKPEPPLLKSGLWNVTDGNMTCIVAELKIGFTLNIGDHIYNVVLSQNWSSSTSNCHSLNDTQELVLISDDGYILTFIFGENTDTTFVRNVTFELPSLELFYNDTKLFSVKSGNSYMCRSTENVNLGNVTMHVFSVHIQAFGKGANSGFLTAEECEADDAVSDVIPITVACTLAALIIIVLIAYLVGRRRSRSKGYTSV